MVNFDLETANAIQLINEIIRITLTEYNALGEKIAQPSGPAGEEKEMVYEMLDKYLNNEQLFDMYFEKLDVMLKESPPGLKELERKQRQLENLIKKKDLE